ncbi:hypothetical protein KIN20_036413 [Parelaphostrongylus tenuis]|uniref:Uncharacterized protein n=1 Tax=Parelaphostrongylus tenuis TaxID=148309 RepID=A0AAD5WLM9_PARTN|nr:hypothetical protein KIN20_036413 [Parelaphostrongylus tenuis]
MALRGRLTAGKRSVLPNLSLAGKREEKTTPASPKKKRNDLKENRSGRARKRANHGEMERPGLIECSGIFSEGLSGGDLSRRSKSVRIELGEPCASVPIVKEELMDVLDSEPVQNSVQTSYVGYDQLWASDDEGDIEELSELLSDGFISDFKHATVLPHVLPVELESQFIDLMHKDVKRDILDQGRDC